MSKRARTSRKRGAGATNEGRRRFLRSAIALPLVAAAGPALLASCGRRSGRRAKRVIVLGIDGVEISIVERLIAQGKLPNLARLAKQGGLRPLRTTAPPQSPICWASFTTGTGPGGHGLFDFIHREPETYLPFLSSSKVIEPKRKTRLGDWVVPLSKGKVELLRQGRTFWEILEDHGVPCTIVRMPSNFPPVESGRSLAGLGTPDILGTYGTFSYYTNDPPPNAEEISGGDLYPVRIVNGVVRASLRGPKNTFKSESPTAKVDFAVYVDEQRPVAKIVVQGQEFLLQQGEWSDWARVIFEMAPVLAKVSGVCRFYLKETHPHFRLYLSPIQIDPTDPALPLSYPEGYAREIFDQVGYYYTQGIAEDTKALSSDVLSDEEYLAQCETVIAERMHTLTYELERFSEGLLFYYFYTTDAHAHMFWRARDPGHPLYNPEVARRYGDLLERLYARMDTAVGQALEKAGPETMVMVVSDHGFRTFRRSFNVNNWLRDNGFLTLMTDSWGPNVDIFGSAEWPVTRAYAVGLNSLYLNLRGREGNGIVERGAEQEGTLDQIEMGLLAVRDPETGAQVISHCYRAGRDFKGPHMKYAPDLIIGYNVAYRVSWRAALGQFGPTLLEINKDKWSGDHCIDPVHVPGLVVCSKPLKTSSPAIWDLPATILAEYGIEPPPEMEGRPAC